MKITWAMNPLETQVELDDVDRRLLHARLKNEDLEDRLFSIHHYLASAPSAIETQRVLEMLDIDYVLDDEPRNEKKMSQWLEERVSNYEQDLMEKHVGDCTCVPCSCSKCYAESLLGIDTIKGLGKHSSYKIDAAFAGGASINEAIKRLENYQPTYNPTSTWPKEDWEKHVPRWIEEGKRAHAWLVAYRDEYFGESKR